MKKSVLLFSIFLLTYSLIAQERSVAEEEVDYTKGVFFVNEDWYGHQNSTVNFLREDGTWDYRIFKKANPGKELGCTTQYGTIYGDKFYLVSKQQQDPGAKIKGSRLAVCDPKTMKCLKEFEFIATDEKGKSIADGRSFLGVDERKGYIGTSNGIWVYDIEKMEIGGQIEGTGNPNGSGYGQLYYAQIGTMVRTQDYVFAVHQQDGLKIIDPVSDTLIKTIPAPTYLDSVGNVKSRGFGSVVQSKDGNLWISMAANVLGNGATLSYMLKMNPYTFEVDTIHFPTDQGVEDIPNSWYAWTADGFCASTRENKIYWNGNNGNSWFKGRRIFCYDIDNGTFSKVFDFEQMEGKWIIYGTGFRLHPVTDEIYCSIFHQFQDPTYETVRISNKGELLQEYPMIINYWFPAMPVFPDIAAPVVEDIPEILVGNTTRTFYPLENVVSDADNMEISIVKTVISNTASDIFDAVIENGILKIIPAGNTIGSGEITVRFNSNGKLADKNVKVTILNGTSIENEKPDEFRNIYAENGSIVIKGCDGYEFVVYNLNGQIIRTITVSDNNYVEYINLPRGVYILRGQKGNEVFNTKVLIR